MGLETSTIVYIGTTLASMLYSVHSSDVTSRQAEHANATAEAEAAAETAANNEATAETTAATIAEAERERSVAITYQEAQNARIEAIAADSAANEKAVAQNVKTRSDEEAIIAKAEAAKEVARIQDIEAQTKGRQLAALAAGGAAIGDESGTAGALLLDTTTRANRDVSATKEAAQSKVNLLTTQGEFAIEQGDVSSKNILSTAEHTTATNLENVKNAGDTLVANAKISGDTAESQTNLDNLITLGKATEFSQQIDSLKSQANSKMWGSILSGTSSLLSGSKDNTTTTSTKKSNNTTGSEALSLFG